jgi:hypothetical protein
MIYMARSWRKNPGYQDFGWNRGSASDVAGTSVVALDECAWIISGCSSLCIKALVWVAGRAGYKDTQTRWNQTARDAGDFLLLQWASTSPAKYPVSVVRHKIPPSSLGVFFQNPRADRSKRFGCDNPAKGAIDRGCRQDC